MLFFQILKRPQIGRGNRILDVITGPYKLSRQCEVTAILILYGLPRYIVLPLFFLIYCFIQIIHQADFRQFHFEPLMDHELMMFRYVSAPALQTTTT